MNEYIILNSDFLNRIDIVKDLVILIIKKNPTFNRRLNLN